MKYRNPKKDSDLFSMIDHQREITQTVRGINKLNDVIDWELFRPELESLLGYDNRDLSKGGRPPFDPVFMLKVLVLQKYHNLSDEQTEFQISDRFSFMQFLGLQPGDSIPDEKTIWDFKQLLDKDGRDGARKLFECFTSQLSEEGMIAREGSIVDARSKLVVGYKGTAASVHDSQVLKDLIDEQDEAVFADSAYQSESSDELLIENDCQNFILFKARRACKIFCVKIFYLMYQALKIKYIL